MNKKMITIEELADGRVRAAADGPQFVANGVNLSTRTIGVHQLADGRTVLEYESHSTRKTVTKPSLQLSLFSD
jgi:hypothetical protein